MLAKKSKKAEERRREVDRVVLDMDRSAFSYEYQKVRLTWGWVSGYLRLHEYPRPQLLYLTHMQ